LGAVANETPSTSESTAVAMPLLTVASVTCKGKTASLGMLKDARSSPLTLLVVPVASTTVTVTVSEQASVVPVMERGPSMNGTGT
jgi:hypothetical protein